jgi:hypothetical protein
MISRTILPALLFLFIGSVTASAQTEGYPTPPGIKSYKGVPGKVTKYNSFNYLDILDESGKNTRQALGNYWEISYSYDSVFRQKRKFKEFVLNEILGKKGSLFFQDTMQVQFVVPTDTGNVWGRLVLSSDKMYRLRMIREVPFVNKVQFDTKPVIGFDKFVDSIALPPRINYLPNSLITRVQHSKYDHQIFTWTVKDTLFKQTVMGPYWDLKIDVRNSNNQVDKQISSVEILESYYRACVKAGGRIIKSRPRELLFILPLNKASLWCRITVSLDGVYFVRAVLQTDQDKTIPEKLVSIPQNQADTTKAKADR